MPSEDKPAKGLPAAEAVDQQPSAQDKGDDSSLSNQLLAAMSKMKERSKSPPPVETSAAATTVETTQNDASEAPKGKCKKFVEYFFYVPSLLTTHQVSYQQPWPKGSHCRIALLQRPVGLLMTTRSNRVNRRVTYQLMILPQTLPLRAQSRAKSRMHQQTREAQLWCRTKRNQLHQSKIKRLSYLKWLIRYLQCLRQH